MPKNIGKTKPYIYVSEYSQKIEEKLKSEVEQKFINFPKELGEEHPFSFKNCEDVCKEFGLIKAIIDKHLDFIISPGFYVKSEEPKIEKLINKFIDDTDFDIILRELIQEALMKGNGFLELAIDDKNINMKVINANDMYVKRDRNGNVKSYKQYTGGFSSFNPAKVIPFDVPEDIVHLKLSGFAGSAYAFGLVYPALKIIDNFVSVEKDNHMLIKRKANSPYHIKIGTPEEPAKQSDVDAAGKKLEYLNNMHEWASDHLWDIKVIDFGNIGDKFNATLESDKEMIFMAFQTSAVLMGSGYQNEGIAQVQIDGFERHIQSIQAAVERVVEEQIFQRIIQANGLKGHIEIEWGQPSEEKINRRLNSLNLLMQNPMISPQLRAMLEIDAANTLQFNEKWVGILPEPQMAPKIERDKEENIKQPEMPGEKPNAKETSNLREAWNWHDDINDDIKLTEWLNFDYMNYKEEVLKFILSDNFKELAGSNKKDYALGLLTPNQIIQLKNILHNNFSTNGTIRKIADELKILKLKNRYTIKDGEKKLILTAEQRRIIIARTESTRVASEGVLNNYKSKGVNEVRFLASISNRTCPICLDLNGQVFTINESRNMIPIHIACRCAWIAVTE